MEKGTEVEWQYAIPFLCWLLTSTSLCYVY